MQGQTADKWETQKHWTVLVAGAPKGAGKTSLALCSPQPTVVIECDLGRVSIPPHVDRSKVLVLPYQDLTRVMDGTGHTTPQKDVYVRLTRDLYDVYKAIKNQQPLTLASGETFPVPKTVVLDGVSRLNSMLIDGMCALQNILDPSDLAAKGKGGAFEFWGKRLRSIMTIVEQFASLPCNVVLTSWIDQQKNSEGVATGVWYPDVGGKMDLLTAGTVGAALYSYSRAGRFYVRTQADGTYPWVGIRDRYGLKNEIDVTIEKRAGGQWSNPWEEIFKEAA